MNRNIILEVNLIVGQYPFANWVNCNNVFGLHSELCNVTFDMYIHNRVITADYYLSRNGEKTGEIDKP
jgi:hypothetical protein